MDGMRGGLLQSVAAAVRPTTALFQSHPGASCCQPRLPLFHLFLVAATVPAMVAWSPVRATDLARSAAVEIDFARDIQPLLKSHCFE